MLTMAEQESTPLKNGEGGNLVFERDKHGNLLSYDKETGKQVGKIYEHGNNKIAKSFNDLLNKGEL